MKSCADRSFSERVVAVSFLVMVAVNTLANLLPLNGVQTGAVSDSYANLFAPAGYTFAVWGLIYLLLCAHVLYRLGLFHPKGTETPPALLRATCLPFLFSSLANAAWIFAWHYRLIPLTAVLMLVLLVCLLRIDAVLGAADLSGREALFLRLPFSVYFGWITVATVANITVLLVSLGWNGFGLSEVFWTCAALAAGAGIGTAVLLRRGQPAYGLVLLWAYGGILAKHLSPAGFGGQYPAVLAAVGICMAVLAAATVRAAVHQRRAAGPTSG